MRRAKRKKKLQIESQQEANRNLIFGRFLLAGFLQKKRKNIPRLCFFFTLVIK